MAKISTNPLDDMQDGGMSVEEKLNAAGMQDATNIGNWLHLVISNSSEHVTKAIVNAHLDICRQALTSLGYIPSDTQFEYQTAFARLMNGSQLYIFDNENLSVLIDEKKLKSLNEKKEIQENSKKYTTVNNLERLTFNREPRQYRRIRRKITFVHDKVLVSPILEEAESTTIPFRIRDTANSNPENDKVLEISNVIKNTLVALSALSSTATKERNSVFLRSIYRDLLNDIETKSLPVYKFSDLVTFFEKVKNDTYAEYEASMRSIYARLDVKPPKRIGFKNSPSVIGKEVHEYLNSEIPDAVHTRELIEQFNLINIVD